MQHTTKARIVALAGSGRAQSLNRQLLELAARGARAAGADVTIIEPAAYQIPIYDGDAESAHGLPEAVLRLQALLRQHNGLLIASPEHNGSVTALLKNTLDWTSRPSEGHAVAAAYAGKRAAILGTTPGLFGAVRGLGHLRLILGKLGVDVLGDELALPRANDLMDAQGRFMPHTEELCARLGATLAQRILDTAH